MIGATTSWTYKKHQYLLGHGCWSYVEGANNAASDPTHRDFLAWEHVASKVLYYFISCVSDHMLNYMRDVKTPKNAWGNLKKIFAASTTAKKLTGTGRSLCATLGHNRA